MGLCRDVDRTIRVLYVDDNQDLLVIGKNFLEMDTRLTVDTVNDAIEAMEIIDRREHDVVVSDYQMPIMDGIEFLKALREKGDDIPFIIFTGKGREEVVIEAFASGADAYVQKGTDFKPQFADLCHRIVYAFEARMHRRDLARHHTAIESSIDGIALFDESMVHDYVNESYARMLGYDDRCDLTGIHWEDVHGEGSLWDEVKRDLEQKGSHISLNSSRRRDGSRIMVESSYTSMEDGFVLIVRDMTELLDKERRLKVSDHRNQALLEALPDIMIILDGEGTFLEADAPVDDMYWMPPSEFIGRKVDEVLPWNIASLTMDAIERVRISGQTVHYDYESPEGQVNETRMVACGDDAFLAIVRDVTDLHIIRKEALEANAALLEERAFLESILENQQEMVCRFDTDTKLTYVNGAFCRELGRDPEELIGTRFVDLIPVESHTLFNSNISSLTPDSPMIICEYECSQTDGTKCRHRWTHMALFSPDGTISSIQSMGMDLTRDKHT